MGNLLEKNLFNVHPKYDSYRTNIIGFSLETSTGNVVGVILGKGLRFALVATDGLPLG